ncbi:MAG: hypothetical protein GY935_02980 [Gammaproteobacteria bacterium]|nr:hypothetical protein [Gammaproteobacteria bacterium]
MNTTSALVVLATGLFLLQGCDQESKIKEETATVPVAQPNVVEIRAVGLTFEGSSEIPSGWTTFKFINTSSMIHFALIDVPPEGITAQVFTDTAGRYFQDAMDGMNAGDEEAVNAAFGKFPAWIDDLRRHGGPGFLSPGLTGETTVYLEPGDYAFECYVKTNGIFHTTSPGEGQLGMMLEFTVTDEKTDAPQPTPNVTLSLENSGVEIVDGALKAGMNTIRVDFVEQQALPSFVGNDVHIMRVENDESISQADAWLDWRAKDGLEDPSPVIFLGGINDMPEGSHGYFTVDLQPGNYAFIAEMPSPQEAGFVLPFTVDAAISK